MTKTALNVLMWLGIPAIGLTLWAWGQPVFSKSGEVQFWVNSIWSAENSQQFADWYTLSHFVMGMLVAVTGRAFSRWVPAEAFFAAAIILGVGWEMVEHTDVVLDRFRSETIYQGYVGDTVLNAVADYAFMMAGYFAALTVSFKAALALMLGLEIVSAAVARDSLFLTSLRVVYPLPGIAAWQDETNPFKPPQPVAEP